MNLNTAGWASPLLRLLARLDSDGLNSTTPVTDINGGNISAANADIALVAKGTGATLAQVPDGAIAGGNKRGTYATDLQKLRTASTQIALATGSVITGGINNSALADYTFIGGGNGNTTGAGFNLTVCTGGQANSVTGAVAFIGGGSINTVSGNYAAIAGGQNNTVSGSHGFIGGGRYGTTRSIAGCHVFPACNAPIASTSGVSQASLLILARQTTDATATVLGSDSGSIGTSNQVVLPNNSAYSFSGEVIAGVTGAGDSARWTINGAIKRGANAASTVMIGTPTVVMTHFDAGAATWVVAVTANTTLGCITVTVTGAASTTIRWVAKIETTEMTY